MRDQLHKALKPIKDRSGMWWLRFCKWPALLRECYLEIGQLDSDLSMVRDQFRAEQSRCETLQKIANESRELASSATTRASTEKSLSQNLSEELANAKMQLLKSSETVGELESRVARMEMESERLKAELARHQADLTRSGLELEREKRGQQDARRDLTLLREFVHRTHRLDIPTRRGIKALLANGKRLSLFFTLLLPLCLFSQFPPPFWRSVYTTNTAAWANTNVISLSTTNATSKPLTNHYRDGVLTLFGLEAGANITLSHNGSNIVITGAAGGGDAGGTNARQFGTLTLTNLSGTGAVTNVVSLSTTNITSKPITNHFENGILTLFGIEQGSGHLTTANSSNIVTANDWVQTASTTNVVGVSNWVNSVSNYVTASTNSASVTNWINFRQPASLNLTNWSNIPTGEMANVVSTTFLTNWANAVSNYVTSSTNSASVTNWINFRQPASANLTNWSLIPTGEMANVVSTTFLTNWANSISNLAQTKQNGSAVLTNLVGTVANNVTNVVSLSTTNATSKPLTNSYTSGILTLFGLEQGANITLTPNGSNIVVASTATGGGNLTTNANQFGASVELTISNGAFLTNMNYFDFGTNHSSLWVEGTLTANSISTCDIFPTTDDSCSLGDSTVRRWQGIFVKTTGANFLETGGGSDFVRLVSPSALAAGYTLILPDAQGSDGQTITNNGAGTLGWWTPGGPFGVNANQFASNGNLVSINSGALFTNLNNFSILSVTNQPGLDRGLRFWHTNGQGYTELSGPTNQWLPTNKFFLTITNPVANQVLKFQNVSYANGVASIVLTNDTDTSGTGTNMLIQTNGTDIGVAGTVNWTTGVTGYLAGAVANLGVNVTGGGSGTNFDSIIITNQVLYQKQHFKSAGSGANTNQVDFTLATHKGFTNALTTNIVCQLTNITQGASCVLSIYGADGAVIASNYTVRVTAATGTTVYWLTSTNGNVDFIVTSNKIGLLSLFADRSTNIFAAWREQVP